MFIKGNIRTDYNYSSTWMVPWTRHCLVCRKVTHNKLLWHASRLFNTLIQSGMFITLKLARALLQNNRGHKNRPITLKTWDSKSYRFSAQMTPTVPAGTQVSAIEQEFGVSTQAGGDLLISQVEHALVGLVPLQ